MPPREPHEIDASSCFRYAPVPDLGLKEDLDLPLRLHILKCSGGCIYIGISPKHKVGQRIMDQFEADVAHGSSHFCATNAPTSVLCVWSAEHAAAEGYAYLAMLEATNTRDFKKLGGFVFTSSTPFPMVVMQLVYKKIDLTMVLNGALAGLVAITAEPLEATVPEAMVIGTVGALIVIYLVPLLDRLKIDDVVGAIPVHLGAGLWGTLCVAYTKDSATLMGQLTGMFAIAVFIIVASALVWLAIKHTMGLRVSEEEEFNGLDRSFLGVESYPEFGQGSQRFG